MITIKGLLYICGVFSFCTILFRFRASQVNNYGIWTLSYKYNSIKPLAQINKCDAPVYYELDVIKGRKKEPKFSGTL